MADELLSINNLNVVYQTDSSLVFAVNGVSLSLNKGEVLGLVGETGAGKTTTALSIMKLLPEDTGFITEGSIILDGIDIINANKKEMLNIRGDLVSMIFQDPMTSLNPVIPVGEQIAEAIRLHKKELSKSEVDKLVDKMFETVGLSPSRKNEYPHQFSGGMKQRIVIAIALCCEPKLLIADEPTTALDVTIQAQVLQLMQNLKQQFDTAMILITHDLGVVAQICDRVAIMYAGEIVESGTIADIYDGDNHHPYTVGLFNAIPDLNKKTERLTAIDGLMPDPADLPYGCVFHPRCKHCKTICTKQKPEEKTVGTHMIRCHIFDDKEGASDGK